MVDRLIPCQELSEELRMAAAELAVEAMSDLYDPVRADILPVLTSEFLVHECELGDGLALLGQGMIGLVAHYPADQLTDRQRASLHHALGGLDREAAASLIAQLRQQSATMPSELAAGQYIARFAVPESSRGVGTADRLMTLFAADRPVISLHVLSDNRRAIAFYRRHGFVERGNSEQFLLMIRA